MNTNSIAAQAAAWALSKVGCSYSQKDRMKEGIFDCSSLVARAYIAQGKRWRHGGSIPTSTEEVYDDDFELLWPEKYSDIGKDFGGINILKRARQPGDLQFICTDLNTNRSNRITHVAMSIDDSRIVHARGTSYGVCTDKHSLYAGKICAICRYNPDSALRIGMKGYRTLTLQRMLNQQGANLDVDGEYGSMTMESVKTYQVTNGLLATGVADQVTLEMLGLLNDESVTPIKNTVKVIGETVNVRTGPSISCPSVRIAKRGEIYEVIDTSGWQAIWLDGNIRWISKTYLNENA